MLVAKFYNWNQKSNEHFDCFIRDIQKLVKSCEFKECYDIAKDRLVLAIKYRCDYNKNSKIPLNLI